MKTIGRTNEGNNLVELTQDEYEALGSLISALGGGHGYDSLGTRWEYADLSSAISTIHTYSRHVGFINALKELTLSLEQAILNQPKV